MVWGLNISCFSSVTKVIVHMQPMQIKMNFFFAFIPEISSTNPCTTNVFAAHAFVVTDLEYSDLTLCDPLSFSDNTIYIYIYIYSYMAIFMTVLYSAYDI